MPRGDNPNSRKNLSKGKPFSAETARIAKKKSDESKRASASLTESLKNQLTPELMDELTMMLIKRAKCGNLKAYELLRDQIGEKPAEHVNISQVDPETVAELKGAISKRLEENELKQSEVHDK